MPGLRAVAGVSPCKSLATRCEARERVAGHRTKREKACEIAIIAAAAAALCTGTAQARTPPVKKSLYERLGGLPAITAVVDEFVGNVARDRRTSMPWSRTSVGH
jgi:hypothetical protein